MDLTWEVLSTFDERTKGIDSDGRSTQYRIELNKASVGTLGGLDQRDYYAITPGVGKFTLYLTSDPLNGFTPPETAGNYLVKITDSTGATLVTSDLVDQYTRAISFDSTSASGTFYVEIESVRAQTFTYAATLLRTPVGIPGDDYAGAIGTTGAITINQTVGGAIDGAGDQDWFRINLTAGTTYRFDLKGIGGAQGSLADPTLLLLNSNGVPIDGDDDTGAGLDSLLIFTPATSGTYFLSAQSFNETLIGTYKLSAAIGGSATGGPVNPAYTNVLRLDPVSDADKVFASDLNARISAGLMTAAEAVPALVQWADSSTSVATLAYEFFTGKIPSAAGLNYLLTATTGNFNNLNSAYYQSFNLENRYINFAVNLGKLGEGKDLFAAQYGNLSLIDATKKAYTTIFGSSPTDAKVHALVDPRADYFAYYGQDGANGIGTKAAMVGWLLAEAVKANIGTYVTANEAFLTDLADGQVNYAVDIVGVYHGTPYVGP